MLSVVPSATKCQLHSKVVHINYICYSWHLSIMGQVWTFASKRAAPANAESNVY